MAGIMGTMAGSGLSSGGRKLVQMVTTATIIGGAGLAGAGLYGQNLPPEAQQAQAFVRDNAPLLVALGVAAIALGAMLSFWSRRKMMQQMQSSFGGMGGMGGLGGPGGAMMPNLAALQGMGAPVAAAAPVVKVRCRACSALQAEGAAFCSSCGKPM